jgi:hypothetical protein
MIIIRAVVAGYEMAKPAKIMTSTPRPIFVHLDLPGEKIPTIISSIPTKKRTIASIKIIEMYVIAGEARANIDRAMINAPKPICTARSQPGDFCDNIIMNYE